MAARKTGGSDGAGLFVSVISGLKASHSPPSPPVLLAPSPPRLPRHSLSNRLFHVRCTFNGGYIDCGSNLPQFARRARIAKMVLATPNAYESEHAKANRRFSAAHYLQFVVGRVS